VTARYARPYADALLGTAGTDFDAAKWTATMRDVAAAIGGNGMLRAVLANPSVKAEAKRAIVESLAGKAGVDELGRRFLRLLLDNRRIVQLPEILDAIGEMAKSLRTGGRD